MPSPRTFESVLFGNCVFIGAFSGQVPGLPRKVPGIDYSHDNGRGGGHRSVQCSRKTVRRKIGARFLRKTQV